MKNGRISEKTRVRMSGFRSVVKRVIIDLVGSLIFLLTTRGKWGSAVTPICPIVGDN